MFIKTLELENTRTFPKARLDFVHPEHCGAIRTLEVQNTGEVPLTLDIFHVEASSVADHKGEFGYNVDNVVARAAALLERVA